MRLGLLPWKIVVESAGYLIRFMSTVLDCYVSCQKWKGLVNLDKCFLAVLYHGTQSTKDDVDVFIVIVGLLEVVVQIVELFNHKLLSALSCLPFLDLFANHTMHLAPTWWSKQLKHKFLNKEKDTVPMAPVAPKIKAPSPSCSINYMNQSDKTKKHYHSPCIFGSVLTMVYLPYDLLF